MTSRPTDNEILNAIEADNDFLAHVLIVQQEGRSETNAALYVWQLGPIEGQRAISDWMQRTGTEPSDRSQIETRRDAIEFLTGQWTLQPAVPFSESQLEGFDTIHLNNTARELEAKAKEATK